jgi:hypothetical protein
MDVHTKEVLMKAQEKLGSVGDSTDKKADIQELEKMKMKRSLSDNFDTDHGAMNDRAQDLLAKLNKQFGIPDDEQTSG